MCSADAPAIILPDKYGGLPMYTRNQTEYSDFVSRYTAPLSMALQNDTVLLGRQGYSVTNESASQPYRDVGFEHNLHKSKVAIDYNTAMIQQRQWLQHQSHMARKQKYGDRVTSMRMNSKNGRGAKNSVDGIFISANGDPMSFVDNESFGDAFYDATNHPNIPSQEILIPGPGGQIQPSTDNLSYNSSRASDRIIESLSFNRRDYTNQTQEEDDAELMRRDAIKRGALINYSPGIESTVSQRILSTAFSTPAPRNPRVRNTELDIDADPSRNMREVLTSAAYTPSGNQALSLVANLTAERIKARGGLTPLQKERLKNAVISHATIASGLGDINTPDVVLNFDIPPSPEFGGVGTPYARERTPKKATPQQRKSSRITKYRTNLSPGFEAGGKVYESVIGPAGKARGTAGEKITFYPKKRRKITRPRMQPKTGRTFPGAAEALGFGDY